LDGVADRTPYLSAGPHSLSGRVSRSFQELLNIAPYVAVEERLTPGVDCVEAEFLRIHHVGRQVTSQHQSLRYRGLPYLCGMVIPLYSTIVRRNCASDAGQCVDRILIPSSIAIRPPAKLVFSKFAARRSLRRQVTEIVTFQEHSRVSSLIGRMEQLHELSQPIHFAWSGSTSEGVSQR
jgi:hypothetical protein